MDTSKKYIEMCEKAVEIQKEWIPAWDHLYFDKFNRLIKHYNPAPNYSEWQKKSNMIGLLRQDQLQEIYGSLSKGYGLTRIFAEWLIDDNTRMYIAEQKFNSQEQLWLIFVMWKKYDKTWDGKKWIKHGERRKDDN